MHDHTIQYMAIRGNIKIGKKYILKNTKQLFMNILI